MKTLPNKDPDEVKDYGLDWAPALGSDTITSSAWVVASAAGMTVDSDSHTANSATIWLSGGADGETGVFTNRVETAGGRTLEETIAVSVVSSAVQIVPPVGLRDPVTPSKFKTIKRAFSEVPDDVVQYYLDQAAPSVGSMWPDNMYQAGIISLTCHLMTLEGLGTSEEAKSAVSGGMVRLKSASVDVQVSQVAADAIAKGGYAATSCGREFERLMGMLHAGPITVGGSSGPCASPYAKDWPLWTLGRFH